MQKKISVLQNFLSVFLTESHFDEDEYDTILKSPNRTAPAFSIKSEKMDRNLRTMPNLSQSKPFNPDERPITPMKDKMVYSREYSSLDFKDGEFDFEDIFSTFKFLVFFIYSMW